MWGQIEGKTKIELAKKATSKLLEQFPSDIDIGLIAYGHRLKGDCNDIELLAPIGAKRADLIQAVSSIIPKGKTPLTSAIDFAREQVKRRDGAVSNIVVSDGKESCVGDPCQAAIKAKASVSYIRLDVVGFDVTEDEAQQLRCVAENGQGKYFSALNAGELAESLRDIKDGIAGKTPLIHHYSFDNDASDSAGNEDGRLLNGAIVRDGILSPDGVDDYVQFDAHIVPVSGSYTLAFFARQRSLQKKYAEFLSQGRSRGLGFYIGNHPQVVSV